MANTTIKLKVEDENIVFTSSPPVFSGDVNTISANFEFGVNWDGLTKYAVFYRSIETPYSVTLSNNECLVPHEVMETAGRMYIGVYGTSADGKIKTSEVVFYDIGTGVLTGGVPSSETLSMWQQILADMDSIKELGEDFDANLQAVQEAKEICEEAAETAGAVSGNINDLLACRIVENATGEAVTVDDASGARLAGLKLYGKSVQNITKGKNLCSVADIEISGSQTVTLDEIPAGTYTISAVVTSTDTDANECLMMFYYTDSNTKEINIGRSTGDTRVSVSVKFDKPVNKVRVYASTAHGTSSGDTATVNDLQIESGSTATAYEPYTDGQPSPENPVPIESVEDVTVSVTGKNLIDFSKITSRRGMTVTHNDDGSITISGTPLTNYCNVLDYYIVLPPARYRVFDKNKDGLVNLECQYEVDRKYYFINSTFTLEQSTRVRLVIQNKNNTNPVNDTLKPCLMFYEGDEPEDVPKYKAVQILATALNLHAVPVESGGNYTDDDGQMWLSDVADFKSGKITRYTNTGIYDGSEDEPWKESVINKCFYMQSNNLQLDIQPSSNAICSHLPYVAFNEFNTNLNIDGVSVDTNPWIRCRYTSISSLADWRQWLSENPITIIFLLSTPTTEDIPANIMQAYKNLHTNAGTTNVFTDSDPQAGIELTYIADTKRYIDKRIDAIATQMLDSITGE